MKLLFDANLSPKLVTTLADVYPGSSHVFAMGEIANDDAKIWNIAAEGDYIIATKDTDFLDLSLLNGAPPKVVLLRIGNAPTSRIEWLLRLHAKRIMQFALDRDESVLIVEQ